jgi:hypothetical protein
VWKSVIPRRERILTEFKAIRKRETAEPQNLKLKEIDQAVTSAFEKYLAPSRDRKPIDAVYASPTSFWRSPSK